jgi:6-phosphogluconolactonase
MMPLCALPIARRSASEKKRPWLAPPAWLGTSSTPLKVKMQEFTGLLKKTAAAACLALACSVPAMGETFVYVSNAESGDITTYRLQRESGKLVPGASVKVASMVMPLTVSPDRRFLFAAVRSKPYSIVSFALDPATGALRRLSSAPLPESMAYISLDKTGHYLFGASYGANLVSVNRIDNNGRVADEPLQVIPVGRNAHSIRVDGSNRFAYVPTLGSDEIFQFHFDPQSGKLSANTPPLVLLKPSSGPRHFLTSPDNRFLYAVTEMTGTVTSFALDKNSGQLTEISSASGLPADSKLVPGLPRGAAGAANTPPRDTSSDIWASDIRMTPDGRFLYMSERTSSTLASFSIDQATGKLSYLGSTPTEQQPRGFGIDPKGHFLVVAGEKADTVSLYGIDQASGALTALGQYPGGKGAAWVEVVTVD